jgi:hypothetical protein
MYLPDLEALRRTVEAIAGADDALTLQQHCDLLAAEAAHTPFGESLVEALHGYLVFGGDFEPLREAFEEFAGEVADWRAAADSEGDEL